MTSSKKHHYIPKFYLNGFTNNDGSYFIFDKKTEEIRKTNPINSFFENNRNSTFVNNEKYVFLEDLYAHFDDKAAKQLEKIRNATIDTFELEPEILHRIKAFIAQMYWRIPKIDDEFEKMVDRLSFKDAGFDFKNKITGESLATPEFQAQLKSTDLFRKMYRIIIPLISAQNKYRSTDYENWRVYFHQDYIHITGDNPLVIKEFIDFSSLNGELLFPISANRLFVHTTQPKPTNLPPNFLLDLDLLILQQATRFICCPDRSYLEFLVNKLYPYFKDHDFTAQMKNRVFEYFA